MTVVALLMSGCGQSGLPHSGGRSYEVLVTGSQQAAVDSTAQLLRGIEAEGLPQRETSFDVSAIVAEGLSQGTRYARNIVLVTTDSTHLSKTQLRLLHDAYAHPQTIVRVEAPSLEQLLSDLPELRQTIGDELLRAEMNNAIANLREHHSTRALQLADSLFGCRLWVPTDLTKAAMGHDFLWLSSDGATAMQSVCVYRVKADTLTPMRMLDLRDSTMRVNIPCERPGAFMTTVRQSVIVRRQPNGATETMGMRGLWATEDDGMGGPFVSMSKLVGDSLLCVEAFVYAPANSKRNMMRRLEACLYTLKTSN